MLLLTRKQGDELQIGEDIKLTVVFCGSGKVQLAITSADEQVWRETVGLYEECRIGKGVRVKITDIMGNKVRLGIIAPPDITVLRREVPDGSKHDES